MWVWLMIAGALVACSESSESPQEVATPKREAYIATGDLDAIIERGEIRVIAPRFDGADALPRSGLPVHTYQDLAEAFAAAKGLSVHWVYVDDFEALIPSLLAGQGDMIVTNMTVTDARAERVDFTRAIAQVAEVVIAAKTRKLEAVDDLAGISVGVPRGSAYQESLAAHDLAASTVLLPSHESPTERLDGVMQGRYDATVLDSDIASTLIDEYEALDIHFRLNKHRPIAWAVRPDNPHLLNQLNQFLVAHHLQSGAATVALRDWSGIQNSGRLRMLTVNNPASYFMWRGELIGFDYELMQAFAKEHGLHLAVVIKDDIASLFEALRKGEGDVIAASLSQSAERVSDSIQFSEPYLRVAEQVVGRADGPQVAAPLELQGHSVGINPQTVFPAKLNAVLPEGHGVKLQSLPDASTEDLIARMVAGEFDFTVADSHLVAIEKTYHANIAVQFALPGEAEIAWGMRTDQPQLKQQLDRFIKKRYRGLHYNVLFNKYFKNERKIRRYQKDRVLPEGKLSPYDDLVKRVAQEHGMDWRLVVSQMYQESKFNPKAKSFAGARGLMQVMPRTAKQLGFENLYQPQNGIAAGIAYMAWLEKRFPGALDFDERIMFTLAAYNAGAGHVRDARRLAKTLGYDENRWFDNVELAMLKLSNPRYYKEARFGYVRGSEPVEYVRKIHERYLGYLQSIKK